MVLPTKGQPHAHVRHPLPLARRPGPPALLPRGRRPRRADRWCCCTASRPARSCSASCSPTCPTSTTSSPPTTSASASRTPRRVDDFAYTFDALAEPHPRPAHQARPRPLRPLRAGLRRPHRLAHRQRTPRADHGDRHPERQRLPRRPHGLLGATARLRPTTASPTPPRCATASSSTANAGSTPTASLPGGRTGCQPDTWTLDQAALDRPGNKDVQLALFRDYRFNLDRYPAFQAYFRDHRPPLLAVWGEHDEIFGPDGARAFARDLPDAEIHLLDAGHFALETHGAEIAALVRAFLARVL